MIRVLQVSNPKDLRSIMQEIRVDLYGIKIMVPKGITHLVRLGPLSTIAATILKQEMLSLGGDVAVARGVLTGRAKKTDCLLMGNLSQYNRLHAQLIHQPFGLDGLGRQISTALENYQRNNLVLDLDRYKIPFGRRTRIMGILNITPDSFSGDGLEGFAADDVIERAEKMEEEGADSIDIGGESTRPGARPVSVKEEIQRIVPLIKVLARRVTVPISIDTHKPEVAKAALDNGACMVNDITGLRSDRMLSTVARYKAGVVIMHMKGSPRTMQKNPRYRALIEEILEFLGQGVQRALDAGIPRTRIMIDPGIGFGKTKEHNLQILKRLQEFKSLGQPILVGPSRKSFIGKILNADVDERLAGTLSACVVAAKNGAHMVRVHDVKEVRQALHILEAVVCA